MHIFILFSRGLTTQCPAELGLFECIYILAESPGLGILKNKYEKDWEIILNAPVRPASAETDNKT